MKEIKQVLFIYIETTGLKPEKDHIWQVAWIKGLQDGKA